MAAGKQGFLAFDPSVVATAGATPKWAGTDDTSGGGLILAAGTYYSKATETAGGGWSDISDQIQVAGAIVGTLTAEISNAIDLEIQKGTDQWDTLVTNGGFTAATIAAVTNGTSGRTIDVSTLDFFRTTGSSTLTARVATAAPLPAVTATGTGVGKTLTATAVGILTVDGVNLVLNDLVLVKNQVNAVDNGLYKVTTAGTAGVAFVLTRDTAMDATGAETTPGVTTAITAGTVNTGLKFLIGGVAQALDLPQVRYPYGRIRYKLVVASGAGVVKDRRVMKAS